MSEPYRKELLQVDTIHKVYFACYGNKAGKPLFVFHGGPGYGFSDDMLEPFDLNEWNIVAIDQRGCGNSIPSGCIEANKTDLLVDDVKRIADYLGIQRFSIKGESWGTTLALLFAEKYPEYVVSMILSGVFLGDNDSTLLGKYGGFQTYYPEFWDQYLELLPEEKRENPYASYYDYIINGTDDEKAKYSRQIVFLELIMEMTKPDIQRANAICDKLNCYSIAKIETFYTINDFFVSEGQIENNIKKIEHIPITIVQGRYDLIVPIKSAWHLSKIHPLCEIFISELSGHSDTSQQTADILKIVARRHLEY